MTTHRIPAAGALLAGALLTGALLTAPSAAGPAAAVEATAPPRENLAHRYVSLALQGRLDEFRRLLEAADPATLSPAERDTADRFRARFLEGADPGPRPDDPFVAAVLTAYRDYWRETLLGHVRGDAADRFLESALTGLLPAGSPAAEGNSGNVFAAVGAGLERAGVHFLDLHGKTLPLYELMVWTRQDSARYDVELTDGVQPVTVVFVRDFLVRGWAAWATFGRASTGGWAGTDALYCLGDDYDPDSERFRVSYLQHEARHFADYTRFPALGQVDLEYRGKLTELAFADTTTGDLLARFTGHAGTDPAAPHAFASHAVMADLRERLPGEPATWSRDDVRATARALLLRSDEELRAAGAATTRGVVVSRRRPD